MSTPPADVTQLLRAWNDGDQAAMDRLMPIVYKVARRYLRRERSDVSLQTTALVHEAYLRLVDVRRVEWQDRAHFFGIAARLIRQILVDFAPKRGYRKRGGGVRHVVFDESLIGGEQPKTWPNWTMPCKPWRSSIPARARSSSCGFSAA